MTAPAVTRRRPEPSPAVVALGTRRRTTELGLLVLAVLIILGAYALASLGRNASLPADIWPFLAVLLALLVGAFVSWLSFEHVQKRVSVWIDPWADPQGSGYQIIQAAYALAWGGTSGVGPGLGIAGRIPYDETDFIFAIIGEELGLLGTTAILCAFLLLAGTGLRVARESRDPFPSLLAVGLTVLIAFQAFIIMGGVTRLLPLTGVTLPFVSYGGSSLVANYVLLALLVRISDQTARRAPERAVAM